MLDLDLEALNFLNAEEMEELIDNGKFIVIDGLLSAVNHSENEIYLTILNGQWNGTASIDMFQSTVILPRDSWIGIFPERTLREPDEKVISVNSFLLILGVLESFEENGELKKINIKGLQIRQIS